ncbi:dehydrogenase [Bradyrhizobium sp. ISRA443]|uniref:ornithine cyclodeaminase family protein n=1 Tax=unclassified Bradyrhizobium TaxID=2631580 RepID=UPI00247B09D2|nr:MULTISPECIES: dehydrogenase [unclassified Bradyrhizobium]WGR91545.1 dehydrogenase [Bradyrhizobium sp. ISRA435]WGS01834.1 dehydrogenase [Bradyrhizobium sp. ISRA436]WGS08720.1 dehydrogenase [Bradyrhizobium sp. ISRA437]WGS15608.1 dehydrogenase [Bradyrhizobium sp. ISRA443]
MHFVDDSEVNRVLTFPILIEAIEAAHRRPKIAVHDGYLGDGKGQQLVTRSAVDAGRFMMTKLYTSFPGNLAHGILPAVQAVCVLFDGNSGRPLAVMDASEITHWKTAADSALGAKQLARPDVETLLVVGAGEMARWLVRGHRTVRPSLRRVLIWNRTAERAEVLATQLAGDGVAAEVATDLDAATREADVITTCTRSREPLVKGANLKPGTHLDLVGGFTPETREADDEAARRARVFVDRRESAFDGVGDILQPIESGAIRERDVLGDHYDLASGKVAGRLSPDDITFFKNAGGGHLDLMTCETVFARLGKELR